MAIGPGVQRVARLLAGAGWCFAEFFNISPACQARPSGWVLAGSPLVAHGPPLSEFPVLLNSATSSPTMSFAMARTRSCPENNDNLDANEDIPVNSESQSATSNPNDHDQEAT
ncbi:hypothetical protein PCANC_20072 [Puccinia coronata f. sp. avenae]|uniref:Uncharacterized protein n=1 Tax=Puccinia coronata f. sp. avenae TaxID=200324 RepID=A0A2N5RUN8_9BASI|nr:hypothetical protein PCANC_28933 [Puccinia coronata f. sp. avenae]PLW34159.1 hypothetical protein PCANC_20072 [Puccinia coronata f. sp. avenae]